MILILLALLAGVNYTTQRTYIYVDGDSNTNSSWLTPDSSWSQQLYNSYPDYDRINVANVGVSGKTVAIMITESPTLIDPYIYGDAYCVLMGGLNDLHPVVGGFTVLETYGHIKQFCEDRQTAGWTMILCTYPADWDNMDSVNVMLADSAVSGGWADAIVRLDLDANIGYTSNHGDATYWYNANHMTCFGLSIISDSVRKHVNILTGRI